MKWVGLILLVTSSAAGQTATPTPVPTVQVCVNVPVSKLTPISLAKDAYNARNGTSFTSLDFAKEAVREVTSTELTRVQQAQAQATVTAQTAADQAANAATIQAVETYLTNQLTGW